MFQYFNVDNGYTRGLELESGFVASGWRLEGAYSGLQTRDASTGTELLGRPAHSGRVMLSRTLPFGVRTSVSAIATSRGPMERDSTSGAITSWRGAFTRLDLRVARSIGNIDISAGADNVFDKQPATWPGFTGRHVYTAVSWNFNRQP